MEQAPNYALSSRQAFQSVASVSAAYLLCHQTCNRFDASFRIIDVTFAIVPDDDDVLNRVQIRIKKLVRPFP